MPDRRDPHAWCRAHLPEYTAGLLVELDAARFRSHLAECEACRNELAPLTEPSMDALLAAEHIPSETLARWDRAQHALRGLPRELVRRHLKDCAECRQDLEALGFEPVLAIVAELEPSEEALQPLVAHPESWNRESEGGTPAATTGTAPDPWVEPRPPIRITKVRVRGRTSWLLAGWAAAATIVATALWIAPRDVRGPGGPGRVSLPPQIGSAGRPAFTLALIPETVTLRPPLRGGPAPENLVRLPHGAHAVSLGFPPLDLPDDADVRVEVLDGAGRTLAAGDYRQRDLYPHRSFVFSTSRDSLAAGSYTLHVLARRAAPPGMEELSLPFTIEPR